eukprot:4604894-Pleurochrysis_carterae.AAC.1
MRRILPLLLPCNPVTRMGCVLKHLPGSPSSDSPNGDGLSPKGNLTTQSQPKGASTRLCACLHVKNSCARGGMSPRARADPRAHARTMRAHRRAAESH